MRRFEFSNFQPCTIEYDGITYATVEHFYQAMKTTDTDTRRRIAELQTPAEAKRAGRALKPRPNWDTLKLRVMEYALREKFRVGTEYARKLYATGTQPIVEHNTWHDTFWGQCDCSRHQGQGENHLGRLLEKIRAELRAEYEDYPETQPATAADANPEWKRYQTIMQQTASLVANVKETGSYDVYIGRQRDGSPGEWGNPHKMREGTDAERRRVCLAYARDISAQVRENPALLDKIRAELRGQVLGCFCAPEPCHGHYLAWLANYYQPPKPKRRAPNAAEQEREERLQAPNKRKRLSNDLARVESEYRAAMGDMMALQRRLTEFAEDEGSDWQRYLSQRGNLPLVEAEQIRREAQENNDRHAEIQRRLYTLKHHIADIRAQLSDLPKAEPPNPYVEKILDHMQELEGRELTKRAKRAYRESNELGIRRDVYQTGYGEEAPRLFHDQDREMPEYETWNPYQFMAEWYEQQEQRELKERHAERLQQIQNQMASYLRKHRHFKPTRRGYWLHRELATPSGYPACVWVEGNPPPKRKPLPKGKLSRRLADIAERKAAAEVVDESTRKHVQSVLGIPVTQLL